MASYVILTNQKKYLKNTVSEEVTIDPKTDFYNLESQKLCNETP